MSEENYSIKVTDEVAGSVSNKFNTIAKSARNAGTAVDKLQAQLNSLGNSSPATSLLNQLAKVETATARAARAQSLNDAASAKSALAQQKLATEVQRTQVELAKVEGVLQKAISAENQAATSAVRLATAQQQASAQAAKLEAARQKAASATKQLSETEEQAAARIKNMVAASLAGANAQDQLAASIMKSNAAAAASGKNWQANAAAQTEAMRNYQSVNNSVSQATVLQRGWQEQVKKSDTLNKTVGKSNEQLGTSLDNVGNKSELARHHMVNLGFQLQDIFVSLASGQKPLTVAIQQGAQIGGIASQAGVGMGTMAKQAALMVARFIPLAAGLALVVGGLTTLRNGMRNGDKEFEGYAKSLGATHAEMKKLGDLTVTYSDMAKGLFETIKNATSDNAFTDYFSELPDMASKAWDAMLKDGLDFVTRLYGNVVGIKKTIIDGWGDFPNLFNAIFVNAFNATLKSIETFTNNTIGEINGLINLINKIPGLDNLTDIPQIGQVAFKELQMGGNKVLNDMTNDLTKNIDNATNSARGSVKQFYKDWTKNSKDAAKERIKNKYDDLYGDTKGEKRSDALAKINADLDSQLKNMFKLADQRAIDQKFDQIQIQLAGQKITLNKQEADSIKSKITAIQEAQREQQAYDQIYEAATGPQKQYNAQLSAAKRLYDQGAISSQQYQEAVNKSKETYESAIDPLRSFKQEIADQLQVLQQVGPAQEALRQRLQIENQLRSQGKTITKEQTDELNRSVEAVRKATLVNDQLNQIYSAGKGAAEELRAKQEAYNIAMTKGDVSANQYSVAMTQLNTAMAQLKVNNGSGNIFDSLTVSLGNFNSSFQGTIPALTDIMSTSFQTAFDGISNGLAEIIVQGGSLQDMFSNLAQTILTELISSLIKMGIQWAINAALSQTLGATATAANVAMAATTASAWAPAAAAVSLATLGSNAGPAAVGMSSTYALASTLSVVGMAHDGISEVPNEGTWLLDKGERVVDKRTNGDLKDYLSSNQGSSDTGSSNVQMNVRIYNNSNAQVSTQQGQDEDGNPTLDVMIDQIEDSLAARVNGGQGKLHKAVGNAYGLQPKARS